MNKHNTNIKSKSESTRVVSPDELVYIMVEILLQLLEFLQHVDVDDGVVENTNTCCKLLRQLAHPIVLATRRSTRYTQTPQDRGVDAVAVVLDDLHAQCLTRVHNISTLIIVQQRALNPNVNNGTSYFVKGFYRKGIRKNQFESKTEKNKRKN